MKRFWNKVLIKKPRDCWQWLASKNSKGYGKFWFLGKTSSAHRIAYELLVGAIPEELVIDHLCKNKACVNILHLEPVTVGENNRRR